MALFKRSTESQAEQPAQTNNQLDAQQLGTTIATAVVSALQPLFGQQQRSFAQSENQPTEPPDDETEDQRIARIANQTFNANARGYTDAFNAAVPQLVRNQVVSELSEWDKVIYQRHQGDIDREFNRAVGNNPALAANPEAHKVAIRMVIGAHTDEIAALQVERLAPEDLPPHLQPLGGFNSNSPTIEPLSSLDQNAVDYFNSSSNAQRRNTWDADSLRYYRSIKPGYLHDMVAEHKQRQAALSTKEQQNG